MDEKGTDISDVLGFSHAEKKVWAALSNEGKTVAEVASSARVPRMTAHKCLQRFVKRTIVKRIKRAHRFLYIKVSPAELFRNALGAEALSGMTSIPLSDSTVIKTYSGIEAMLEKLTEHATAHKHERWVLVQSNASAAAILKHVPLPKIKKLNKIIFRNKQITDLYIEEGYIENIKKQMSPTEFKSWLTSLKRMSVVYILPKEQFHSKTDLMIFRNSLYILDWHEQIMFEIEHRPTIEMIRKILEALSHTAKHSDIFKLIEQFSNET